MLRGYFPAPLGASCQRPGSWVLVPGPLSVAGCVEIDECRCLLGTVAGFWTGGESLFGTGRGEGEEMGKREREKEREEQLYYSLS